MGHHFGTFADTRRRSKANFSQQWMRYSAPHVGQPGSLTLGAFPSGVWFRNLMNFMKHTKGGGLKKFMKHPPVC